MNCYKSNSSTKLHNQLFRENRLKSKILLLDNQSLEIHADKLDDEDWKFLMKVLKDDCIDLHSIVIRSKYFRNQCCSKSNPPKFFQENLLNYILEALKEYVINSKLLCSIHLEGFPLINNTEMLTCGIQKQTNLQHLALPYCNMTNKEVIVLCRSIYKHIGLQSIDLSGCGITSEGAKEIASVIRCQKFVRYGETWKQSLRYRLPQPEIIPGLKRITLNDNNKIGDEGFKLILYELMDDLWIKAVDIQNCGLTDFSIQNVIDLIKTNPIIQIVDIRRNNIANGIIKNITELLKKNIICSENDSYSWIKEPCFSASITNFNKNKMASCSCSMSNLKTNDQTSKSLQGNKNISDRRVVSETIFSELKETKIKLRKLSSSLIEEKIKRESIEREHNKFKQKIEDIRNYLKQYNIMHRKNNYGKSVTSCQTADSMNTTRAVILAENNKNVNKKNNFSLINVSKGNLLNSCFGIGNHPLDSMKLLLVIPAENQNGYKNDKYNHRDAIRSKSCNTKRIIKNHTKQSTRTKSEPLIKNRKHLKSTIAINNVKE